MTSTRAWALRELAKKTRITLDSALLTEKGARYAALRTWAMGLRAVLRTALHAAELWVLTRDFPYEFLIPLLALRALPPIFSGLHWGALEALRARTRRDVQSGMDERARCIVEGWLTLTSVLGMLLFAGVTWIVVTEPTHSFGPDGLYGSFALVCGFMLTCELWTRTYHAGVFALGRVYRPLWSMFVPELFDLGVLVLSYPRFGPFALHLTVLAGTALRSTLTFVYARRAYRARGLALPALVRPRALGHLSVRELGSAVIHGLATLPLTLDRLLLLALLKAPAASEVPLALPLYALRPIAGYTQSWTRAFYADFVRLDQAAMGALRTRFEHLLRRVSLVVGLSATFFMALGSLLIFGTEGLYAALWLAPWLILRARFSLDQLRGLSYGALTSLARAGAVLVVALVAADHLALNDQATFALLLVTLMGAQWVARVKNRARERKLALGTRLPMSAWLADVSEQHAPLRIAIARVDRDVARPGAVLNQLAHELTKGHVARLGKAWLLWWEPAETARSHAAWAGCLGGALRELAFATGENGKAALQAALTQGCLPAELACALTQEKWTALELRARAKELLPEVRSVDARRASPELSSLSARELAVVRRAILAEAREQRIVPSFCPFQVGVYAPKGEPELVFVWPAHTQGGGALQRELRLSSWRASVQS